MSDAAIHIAPRKAGPARWFSSVFPSPSNLAALIVLVCCVVPLAWLVYTVALNPTTLRQIHFDSNRMALLGRTILYNGSVGVIATLMAIPAAWVLGRGRGFLAHALWFVLPISLLMPSLVLAYGWKQFIQLIYREFDWGGFWDISRCVWSLATWLWPVPAIIVGLALRRSDPQVQQQAQLDGVLKRTMLRQVIGPLIGSMCIVSLLAMQEFAVYEPTGISVVATELRMVFETGAYSSSNNPIIQPMGTGLDGFLPDQRARAAAAVATALPMLGVIVLLAGVAVLATRRLSAAEHLDAGAWPGTLDAPKHATFLSFLMLVLALGVPITALVCALGRPFDAQRVWTEFSPQLIGSLEVALLAGVVGMLLAAMAIPQRRRWLLAVALGSFLVGGQLLAIAMIRVYNRQGLTWVYDGALIVVIAYIGRFGWIVLAAAAVTWSPQWRQLRDLAELDGATEVQTALGVIWPLAWPVLGASAMFVLILSLSEVPATVLISPQRPQMLVNMLMTWVHMMRYDAMIEASLLMAGLVVVLGAVAIALGWFGMRLVRIVPLVLVMVMLTSCGSGGHPDEIWSATGTGPGQVVYPRAIAYSRSDDSFYVVDREARIQHFDRQGKWLTGWRTPAWERGKPVGLTIGPDGDLYVPDTHYHRVLVYSPKGELKRQWGGRGTGPGQFTYPTDVAFDSRGNIFVSEYGDNDRIQVFNQQLEFLYQFGKFGDAPGDFSRPQSMVIDGDTLYVTDACNHRLAVFKTDGTFVRFMGKVGSELGEFRFPYGLDIDSNGRLVVCEFGNNRVQLVDKQTGAGLAAWGMAGREPGKLAYPWGVAVDSRDRVVAVDAGNNRFQVFRF